MGRTVLFFCIAATTLLNASQMDQGMGSINIWLAIFIVALIGLGIFFFAQRQIKNISKFHEEMLSNQREMEEKQNQILTSMSENVHSAVQKILEKNQGVTGGDTVSTEKTVQMMEDIESQLMCATNDLIYFLQLKSKKIEINNQPFNLNNVLNEVSGLLGTRYSGKEVELIFEVNNTVPRHMIGDSLHFGRVLTNIFEFMFSHLEDEELKLEVSLENVSQEDISLQFKFRDNGPGLSYEEMETLFSPYFDEESGTYVGLGLFIARSLAELMGGQLNVENAEGKGMKFILDLPFKLVDPENRRKYRLPDKSLIEKNVLIVDASMNSALAIKKMFTYFRHEVKVIKKEEFEFSMPKMDGYDIIILNESLFEGKAIRHLREVKEVNGDVKIIALNSLLNVKESKFYDGLIDAHLFKPVNQERVFELIISLYDTGVPKVLVQDDIVQQEKGLPKAVVHRSEIKETKGVTQESFSEFSGKQLLVVEDNAVNQKVLTNLLSKSGIKVTIANDGREAVEHVKSGNIMFDLILMDINMPVMDGFTATQVIREERKFDVTPIVAFTALILESEKQKMFNCGMNAFLAKPLNIGKLYHAMSMFISEKGIKDAKKKAQKEIEAVFEGLDIQKGITQVNNSEAFYIELLKEFVDAYGNSDETFATLVKEKRYEQIKMLCIDMRGLSGTIGAYGIQHLVNEVYKHVIFKKHDLIEGYVRRYSDELSKVKRAIKAYLYSKDMLD